MRAWVCLPLGMSLGPTRCARLRPSGEGKPRLSLLLLEVYNKLSPAQHIIIQHSVCWSALNPELVQEQPYSIQCYKYNQAKQSTRERGRSNSKPCGLHKLKYLWIMNHTIFYPVLLFVLWTARLQGNRDSWVILHFSSLWYLWIHIFY